MNKIIDSIKHRYKSITSHRHVNKYTVTLGIFVIWLLFFDGNSLLKRFRTMRQQRAVDREIEEYRKSIEENQRLIDALGSSKDNLEQFAREHYHMKQENEEIFIIKE